MRWTPERKASFVKMFRNLTYHEKLNFLSSNNISLEEFDSWIKLYDEKGLRGLHVTVKKPKNVYYEK